MTKIYNDESFEYFQAPGLQYFNVVINNTESNYDTFRIWVLKEDKDANSLNEEDWDIYEYDPKTTRFTNRPETVQPDNGYILIEDGAVIRLVYTPAKERINYDATFYDYDITDGKIYSSETDARTQTNPKDVTTQTNTQTWYANVNQKGINSSDNYSADGSKLAFGNGMPTGLEGVTWSGNKINQNNAVNATGCTFGLVKNSLSNGMLQYNVNAPKLFNEGDAIGKTQITDRKLSFARVGDTYTLSSVVQGGNAVASNLEQFSKRGNWNNTKFIYSNNFWPLDALGGSSGHDLKFGLENLAANRKAVGASSSSNFPTADFPKGEGIDRNSYFGMHFGVSFELTKNYVGPLEYYFFGDDDMWVFLEDPNGNTRLICDIGGVHTSVGEYVNLWDYINKDALNALGKDENGKDQKLTYKLKFFYTERGASGSTCWMQFTLPTVVGLDLDEYLEQQVTESTGALRIEKQLDGVENSQSFEFKLDLSDIAADNYMVRGANGELLTGENALNYIGNGDHFKLQAGDVLLIKGLPQDAEYTITELTTAGYHTEITTSVDGTVQKTEQGVETKGTIQVNKTTKVVYTNHASYELPATGGSGTFLLYASGGALILFALVLMFNKKTRRKGGSAC